jgi:hypothetical protein
MHALLLVLATLCPAAGPDDALEPWAANRHPEDAPKRRVEDITAAKHAYIVTQGGTMDGTNCRSPIGGGYGIWDQAWESNRAVRLANVGDVDVVNPWLANGRNNFRSVKEIVAAAVRPGMSDREKAIALWRLQTTHRFHASAVDAEMSDPVKVFNVYGYTTCGDDSICLAGLWRAAGFKVRPARTVGHCISQVFYDGRWNLLDGDMGPFYLLRDNRTIASEQDLVRDHDLLKRTHTHGVLDPDSRGSDEVAASLFVYEGQAGGERNAVQTTTMNMVLRPNEALTWRWGHLKPLKYHGRTDINVWGQRSDEGKVWGARAADRICNGTWEYRPDLARELWRKGAESAENIVAERGGLTASADKSGVIVWKMQSPYVFVGGRIDAKGTGAKFSLSWDGKAWQEVGTNLDSVFPSNGPARYGYRLKCELPAGARLERLAIVNDLQMAPLVLPGMVVGNNQFTYTDESTVGRKVRVTHEWVERSLSKPPAAPPAPVSPPDGAKTDGTHVTFEWQAPASSDKIADYHFELSDRADMAWPLSAAFSKLIGNTADRDKPRYRLAHAGLLTPGQTYYWRVRAKNVKGVWGPWGKTWKFTADGPAQPLEVRLEPADGRLVLRWKPNPEGRPAVAYRIYGSDEKGFSASDEPYKRSVGISKDVSARAPANFVAAVAETELLVAGPGLKLPNTNKPFYRVVAVDRQGTRSGPSDYAVAPRPFVFSSPSDKAKVGAEYQYQLATLRSIGDLRMRVIVGKETTNFWDIEKPRFTLVQGPAWLRIDADTGLLRGTPDAVGTAEVVVSVTLERVVQKLDDTRLMWGREEILGTVTEKVGSTTQRFKLTVE